jgi:hypothetical protein
MPVQEIWVGTWWAAADGTETSVTGTLHLPGQKPFAVGQVTLTRSAWFDTPGWSQIYFTGYSANGNPVTLNDFPFVLGIKHADSFSIQGDVAQGALTAVLTVYCWD